MTTGQAQSFQTRIRQTQSMTLYIEDDQRVRIIPQSIPITSMDKCWGMAKPLD